MNNFNNNNMFDDNGFLKFNNTIPGFDRSFENTGQGLNDWNDLCDYKPVSFGERYEKMTAANEAMCDFFNNSLQPDDASAAKKPEPSFIISPAAMPYAKRVTFIEGGQTHFGYFVQTDPSPYLDFQPALIKGEFTNEITGEKKTVTVTDMNHDLTVWGVVSYIFKIFNW